MFRSTLDKWDGKYEIERERVENNILNKLFQKVFYCLSFLFRESRHSTPGASLSLSLLFLKKNTDNITPLLLVSFCKILHVRISFLPLLSFGIYLQGTYGRLTV